MKLVAYLLSVMLLGIGALAQNAAKQPSKDPSPIKTPAPVLASMSDDELASLADENNTCYTIRAYFFRQSEDGTLEPAGMTTCVKSSQRALKRAQKNPANSKPEVRLVH
jgi:hypothetical protein